MITEPIPGVAPLARLLPLSLAPIADLPPFPPIALKLLQLATEDGVSMAELAQLIGGDPAFTAEVLRIANSPLCGTSQPVKGVLAATSLLGLSRIKGLAITVGVRAYLGDQMSMPGVRGCWRHSLACALLSRRLALASFADYDASYTAGIMHDIGRLAMIAAWPKQYSRYLQTTEHGGDGLLSERQVFGADHCALGRDLAAAWNLPKPFPEVVGNHHEKVHSGGPRELVIVSRGCRMADSIGFSATHSAHPAGYEEILQEIPQDERRRFDTTAEAMALRIATEINSVETA